MTDRNRTLLAIAVGALVVVALVAGFSIAENGWGGDDDDGESGAVTYCVAIAEPLLPAAERATSPTAQTTLDLFLGTAVAGPQVYDPDGYFEDDGEWDDRITAIEEGAPSLIEEDVDLVADAADDDDSATDPAVLEAARRVAADAEVRCGVVVNIPQI